MEGTDQCPGCTGSSSWCRDRDGTLEGSTKSVPSKRIGKYEIPIVDVSEIKRIYSQRTRINSR